MDLERGLIDEACLHVDVIGVMHQAGHYPLPPPTGVMLNPTPGPMTHDGILNQPQARSYKNIPLQCFLDIVTLLGIIKITGKH